jgi:hypothetical protein
MILYILHFLWFIGLLFFYCFCYHFKKSTVESKTISQGGSVVQKKNKKIKKYFQKKNKKVKK